MQNFLTRMITERDDLKGKISRAKKAVENPPFNAKHLDLLSEQITYMESYLKVLEKRISLEV